VDQTTIYFSISYSVVGPGSAVMRLFTATLSACYALSTGQQEQQGGHQLWVKHVTAGRRVSIWSNKAQLEAEALQPSLPADHTHPWAMQTRWDLTKNVQGVPAGTEFVLIEMGPTPFCGTDSCSDTIVLFGLSTANKDGDVRLKSYKGSAIQNVVKGLHANATTTSPLIRFDQMNADAVSLVYKFYPSNSSFYGIGGGKFPDGGRIEVRELIGDNLVAPLEVFYDSSGTPETEYVTPLVYHHSDKHTDKLVHTMAAVPSLTNESAPTWPPQVAPVMPTMFTAKVKGFSGNATEHGVWNYDWPRNRLRNDYVVTDQGQTYNMTQLWLADQKKFFVFFGDTCSYSELDLGMLRPDSFENAMRTDPYDPKGNPSGARCTERVQQDGRWSDHFVAHLGPQQFNLWQDIETNLPLYDYGPGNYAGELAGNHWSDWQIGKVPESVFALDTSKCKKESILHHMRMPSIFMQKAISTEAASENIVV